MEQRSRLCTFIVSSGRARSVAPWLVCAFATAPRMTRQVCAAPRPGAISTRTESSKPSRPPHLSADVRAALHLSAGAGRAAFQILLVNAPDTATLAEAEAQLERLAEAERAAITETS